MAAHIVVALIALVAIGGATRVMEAGLACPDWPLCYGSFLPMGKMNIKVFLEWFHRLDAFFVGLAILLQFLFSLIYRSFLPKWLPWINGLILLLVVLQGALGAVTVFDLLPSTVVMGHMLLALILVGLMSALTQRLLSDSRREPPSWWKLLSGCSLIATIAQCLIGSRIATTWTAQKCIASGEYCYWLDFHRASAIPVALGVISFASISIFLGGWFRAQLPLSLSLLFLLSMQIFLGVSSLSSGLTEPLLRVLHQVIASLMIACLAALGSRMQTSPLSMLSETLEDSPLEAVCHG
ncbi:MULTISPECIES: COX15/CtaA family protein [unclassified Prochlorococcus]|uniref:COX15/CtaA family protein n=1 Tax=unclassified Prochlorococcus TaxID=2627481 RepID=UPI0005338475|nr:MULTISPECIES: COX15/CtaA family protein [unclassified Prochlorococcus]KGG16514.1 Heme A synthase [Prochlorococcus sp. MIT 0602]KGG17010.1 Heme A synthase [Prochlorococcus sp. MIT 0603]